jgi:hypothetical protein
MAGWITADREETVGQRYRSLTLIVVEMDTPGR